MPTQLTLLTDNEFKPFLDRYIPELARCYWKTLSIILPGPGEEVRIAGKIYIRDQCLTVAPVSAISSIRDIARLGSYGNDQFAFVEFRLLHNRCAVNCEDFINELYRIVPCLKDLSIIQLTINLQPRGLVELVVSLNMKADLNHGFTQTYELEELLS